MLTYLGTTFPGDFLWAKYEIEIIESLKQQIENRFGSERNLFINSTWFGSQFNNPVYYEYLDLVKNNTRFDNLFFLASVDPALISQQQIAELATQVGAKLFKIGNFDTEYHFNFFAPVLAEHFQDFPEHELILHDPKYLFINYNRKPREHRVQLVKKLIEHNLKDLGIVTLGRPNVTYDKDPDNNLYFSIGEKIENYNKNNHWFSGPDEFDIPHDVLTLHRFDYWQKHFLNIVGATEFNPWDDIFVSETQFKPILGLRPFVINGNVRTYQWLRDNGFKTFNQYFGVELEDIKDFEVHDSIIQVVKFLSKLSKSEILSMYNDMLPDLKYNKQRFFEYAHEQKTLVDCIL